ncbi:hypothetical protein RZS08_08495, partial [Arthrospira platensis SPKY1]|nr:hypothetical protein [Arthrospira platensis SPKY1]
DLSINELDTPKPSTAQTEEDRLAAFLRPDPTYSLLWFSGTRIQDGKAQLGLQTLGHFPSIRTQIAQALGDLHLIQPQEGSRYDSITHFIDAAPVNKTLILANQAFDFPPLPPTGLDFSLSNYKSLLADCLRVGFVVLTKAPHQHGFDLMLNSHTNLYTRFFEPFKSLLPTSDLRIFSINLKRMDSERKLYFELHSVE